MDDDKYLDAAEFLHVMVQSSKNKIENGASTDKPSGYVTNLEGNSYYLNKFKDLKERKGLPKFGVFGPRKRGKSSMLNALIGADILPVSVLPMTRTAVEVQHDEKLEAGKWEITLYFPDRRISPVEALTTPKQVNEKIVHYGTAKAKNLLAETIEIRSNFSDSEILKAGGILVDTPGAEAAIGKEDDNAVSPEQPTEQQRTGSSETLPANENDFDEEILKKDTERALEILNAVDVVIFCSRGNLIGSKDEMNFYDNHLSQLRPLIVMNWKDVWEGNEKDPVAEVVRAYGVPWDRTLTFSAKWAKEGKEKNDQKRIEESGLLDLQKKILSEIDYIRSGKGIGDCFREYDNNIQNYIKNEKNEMIVPLRIHVLNFYVSLKNIDEEWSKKIRETLENNPIWAEKLTD